MGQRVDVFLSRIPGLSCRRAIRLSAKEMDAPLGRLERIEHRFHLGICGFCERYTSQIHAIARVVAQFGRGEAADRKMPPETAARIKSRLAEASGEDPV